MICAAEAEGGKDSCQGDSGGPVAEEEPSKTDTIWEEKYRACKTKLRALRSKYKAFKESHSSCSQDDESEEIWEGSEVRLRRSEISALMTLSPSITFFARNLFRRVFTVDEIIGYSLLGRKSTAMEHHIPLPSIDPRRRDAIIEFCLKSYGFEVTTGLGTKFLKKRKAAKTRIIKSLSDFMREENAKAKKLNDL